MMKQFVTGNIGIGNTSTLATFNKCFGFTKMDAVIPGLLDSIRKATSERREYGKGKKVTSATAKVRT